MKRILFLCASLFLAHSIDAQISQKPTITMEEGQYLHLTSPVLSYDGKPIVYTEEHSLEKLQERFVIFDTDFSVVKELVIPYENLEQTETHYALGDNGVWNNESYPYQGSVDTRAAYYYYYNPSISAFEEEGYITQTFFNDDADYEYILPLVEKGHWEFVEDKRKTVIDGYAVVGIKVVNDKGKEVCSVKTNAIMQHKYEVVRGMYTIGDDNYLLIGDGFYKVDKLRSSLTKVAMPARFSVSPTIARRNTLVNVSFDASDSPRAIKVIGGNGMECQKINVAPGTESVGVDTSRLSPGVYVVMMSEGGKNVEKCKIVVR